MNSRTIEKNIGKPTKIDWKKPKAIGSSSFYLKSFKAKNNSTEFIMENSKCSFEKYSGGILLRSNLSNKTSALTIKESEIEYIKLIRGKESVEPLTLSPMWIMLKLGVSKSFSSWSTSYNQTYDLGNNKEDLIEESLTLAYNTGAQYMFGNCLTILLEYKSSGEVADRDLLAEDSIYLTFNFRNIGDFAYQPKISEFLKD